MALPKVAVVGARGFLGETLSQVLADSCIQVSRRVGDPWVMDFATAREKDWANALREWQVSHVIVCGGITDVQKCYQDPQGSREVNVLGTIRLFRAALDAGVRPVFFSSEYVFDGKTPFVTENHPVSPTTIYGRQKVDVENWLFQNSSDYLIFRTSKQMSFDLRPRNILAQVIQKLHQGLEVQAFTDQWTTPVFVEDIASAFKSGGLDCPTGTYHLAALRAWSRFDLALEIANQLNFPVSKIVPIRQADLKFQEIRPHHNSLNSEKFRSLFRTPGPVQFREPTEAFEKLRAELNPSSVRN